MKRKSPIVLIIASLIVIGGALVIYYLQTKPVDRQQTAQPSTPAPVVDNPKIVELKLPGAKPIPANLSDYNDPDSIWTVVNKEHVIAKSDYVPADLSPISFKTRSDKSLDERSLRAVAMDDAAKMIEAASLAGHDLMSGSAFRSYDLQNTYYTNYVRTYGQSEADKFSAKPGHSEHQTGLVMDLAYTNMNCYLSACFGDSEAGKWLAEHSTEYGFILRYPADKTDITGYMYEPWHFRYVGHDLAKALKESGLTLDEAYPYLQEIRGQIIT